MGGNKHGNRVIESYLIFTEADPKLMAVSYPITHLLSYLNLKNPNYNCKSESSILSCHACIYF